MIIDNLSRSEIEYYIDEWIVGKNAERNRAMLKRRFLYGVKFETLAEEFDLSVRQTKNIIRKDGDKLFRVIERAEK